MFPWPSVLRSRVLGDSASCALIFSLPWAQSKKGTENIYVLFIPKSQCRTGVLEGHDEPPLSATDENRASHKANPSLGKGPRVQRATEMHFGPAQAVPVDNKATCRGLPCVDLLSQAFCSYSHRMPKILSVCCALCLGLGQLCLSLPQKGSWAVLKAFKEQTL